MSERASVPIERAIAAWLAHLQDLGVEALRAPLPDFPEQIGVGGSAPPGAGEAGGATQPGPGSQRMAPVPVGQVRATPGRPPPAQEASRREEAARALRQIREEIGDCQRCKLCSGRTHLVYGVGDPSAELVFVGEAPGRDEDLQGEPFVGRAGQLLTRIIEAMGMRRQEVYIANIIKCRPPGNRLPEREEIAVCQKFLLQQIDAIQPRIVVSLGGLAAQILLQTSTPISRLRGMFRDYRGALLMPTFHPAFLLRNPSRKREVWEDMQKVRDRLFELRRKGRAAAGGDATP
ncbi:MAG: uracil-DNA glycosylase [Acidobacteriota bacterium]